MLLALALGAALLGSEIDTTFSVQRGQRLELGTHSGDIVVHTWSRNEVRVRGSSSDPQGIQIDHSATVVSIHSLGRHGPPNADFDVTIPAWMGVRLSGVTSTMRIEGVQSPVSAETVEGDVTVVGGSGVISLRSVQGEVSLAGANGKMDLNSVNSDVKVHDVNGDLQAETVNGDVELNGVQSDNVEASALNGEITYDGAIRANGRYRLSTHNGDLTVAIPENAGALVTVSTFQGDFESAFPVTLTERHNKRFEFTVGNGSARVELESFGGTVRLVRPGGAGVHRHSKEGRGRGDD